MQLWACLQPLADDNGGGRRDEAFPRLCRLFLLDILIVSAQPSLRHAGPNQNAAWAKMAMDAFR
eukprot:3604197-Lingulodinium_polyedra.AAC.1